MASALRGIAFVVLIMTSLDSWAKTPQELALESRVSTVFIKVEAESSTGAISTSSGSGFVIHSDGYVITAGHVVPIIPAGVNGSLKISGTLQSRAGVLEDMELIARDPNFDFALLRFKNTAITRIPVHFGDPWRVPLSSELFAMGFPLGTEFGIKSGHLVGTGGPAGAWITDTALNPGDSGGPVFNDQGKVVAMVSSAIIQGEGIKFVLPINFANNLLKVTGQDISKSVSHPVADLIPVKVSYPINETRSIFSGLSPTSEVYTLSFDANEGKRIIRADLVRQSDTRLSDVDIKIAPDGEKVIFSFRLTSGPIYDQYRGWLKGDLVTQQVPRIP